MIKIKNLSKTLGRTRIFDNFNLGIKNQELVVIFGPSGCGKTTLLNLLAGVEDYQSGSIEGIFKNQKFGYVSQSNSLLPWLSVLDNVAFGLKLQGVKRSKRHQKANEILNDMNLKGYSNFYPHQLSGGLTQLVSFARAVAYEAELMFMDEPFSSLDFFVRSKLQKIIMEIHEKQRLTTVFITHNVDEALYLADRIVALSPSKPTEILNEFDTSSVRDQASKEFYRLHRELLMCYQ